MRQEGTLRRAPDEKRPTALPTAHPPAKKKKKIPTKGIVLKSLVPSASSASSSESSPPRRIPGQFGSGPSVPAFERMMLAAQEEPSVDQPSSPRASLDGTTPVGLDHPEIPNGASPLPELEPAMTLEAAEEDSETSDSSPHEPNSLAIVVMEEPVARRSSAPRALTTDFGERHQRRLYEVIELSDSSAPCERPEAVESPAGKEDSSDPILVSDNDSPDAGPREEGGAILSLREEPAKEVSPNEDSADAVENIFACPPNCAEMEEILKQIPRSADADLSPSQLFESAETVIILFICMLKLH